MEEELKELMWEAGYLTGKYNEAHRDKAFGKGGTYVMVTAEEEARVGFEVDIEIWDGGKKVGQEQGYVLNKGDTYGKLCEICEQVWKEYKNGGKRW